MAEAGLLQLIESTKISKAFKEKLLVFGRAKDKEMKVHEAELLKLRTDHERKNCELERKFMETTRLQEEESNKSKKAQLACKQLETNLEDLEEKCKTLQEALDSCNKANNSLARDVSSWEDQKLSFNHIIDKKDTEIKFITDEWNNTSKRLREVTDLKNDLQLKYDAISGSQANLQFRIKRIEEERDFLTEQNSQVTLDLSRKTAELSALQREKASELSTLKTKFEIELNQNKHLLETIANLKKNDGELHQQIANLQERITKETDDYHSMEGILRNELQAKTRLAELYSASADDNEKKSSELLSAVEELQEIIKPIRESNENLKLEAEKQRCKAEEEHKQVLRLTKELETANDLIESKRIKLPSEDELAKTHPIAALTAQSIKSGMTLTQMYSRIVELDEEVDVTKMENKRLNEAMETVLEELHEKSPAILRLKRDYEQALMTVNKLTALQNEAVVEFQTLREETDDAVRKSNYLNRELERYKSESADQSRQITHLLKEVEEMRGRRVSMQSPRTRRSSSTANNSLSATLVVNDDGSCNDVSSSSELITSTLVTFKDIADLQDQNKKLLAVVRTLSNEQEKSERETSDERLKGLQSELDEANDELERLRHDRKRQIELVNGIVRQRDMYKILLSQEQNVSASVLADPSHASFDTTCNKDRGDISTTANMTSSPIKSSPGSILSSPNRTVAQLRSELEASKKILKQQKDDSDHLKEELNANFKIVEKQLEDVKGNLSDERVTCAKIEAQLHFSNERYQSMKKNMENYKKESDVYRTRYEDSNRLNGRLEQEISSLRSDCRNWQEQVSTFEVKLEGQQRKLHLVNQSNVHMNAQNEKLKSELANQRELLSNYRKSQESMQEQEAVARTRLNATLDSLQSERDAMSLRHQEEIKSYQERTQGAEKQSLDLQNMRKADVENIRKLNKELMEAHQKVSALEEGKTSTQLQLTNAENRLKHLTGDKNTNTQEEDLTGRDSEVTVARLQREIRQKTDEVASLETKIEKIKQSVDYYKEAATIAEDNLKKHNTENQVLLDRLQERLDMNSSHITELEQKIALLGEENAGLKNEKFTASDEMERKTNEVRKQMTLLQTEVESATKRMEEAINEAEKCRNDLTMQENRAEEANTKYQREVMHHSELMKELMELQETNKKNVNTIKDDEMKCRSLERVLHEKEQNWVSTEEQMKSDNDKDKERIKELESQNSVLHENIQQISDQLQQALNKKEHQQRHHQQQMMTSPVRSSPRRPLLSSSSRADQAVSAATAAADAAEALSKTDTNSTEKLLEVIRFLRREKEISTTECELKKSELSRLEMRLQHSEKQHKTSQEQYIQAQKIIEENQKQLTKLKIMEREVASHQAVQESNVSLRDERDSLTVDLREANNKISQLQAENAPLQTRTRELSLGNNALLTEKKMLKEEVERWKHRVEQITSSPRRAEPEETRRLVQEKQALLNKLDSTNRELAETRSEGSSLKGKIRSMEMELQSTKTSHEGLQRGLQAKEADSEKMKKTLKEEKEKFIKVKNLARKFKSQLEEMHRTKKLDQEELEKLKSELSGKDEEMKKITEEYTAASAANVSTTGGVEDKNEATTQTDQTESADAAAQQKTEDESALSASIQIEQRSEISALRASLEEKGKQMEEKEKQMHLLEEKTKKLNRCCAQYRQQIEKSKKTQLESVKVAEGLKEEVKRLEEEKKLNTELQNKLEDLQRQLIESRSTRSLSSNTPSVTAQPQQRKAVNVRPIGQQRVNQVPPYLRTARVIPEQREDVQDIAVTDRPGSSAMPQVPSSSTQSTAVSASVQPSISTALVYPMSPARLQQQQQQQQQQQPQQHVVSSGTQQQQTAAVAAASSSSIAASTPQQQQQHTVGTHTQGTVLLQPTLPIPRFHDAAGSSSAVAGSSSAGNVGSSGTSTGAGSGTTSSNTEAATSAAGSTDNEQAIVSSSDDQAMHEENRGNVNQPSSSQQSVGGAGSSSNTSGSTSQQQSTFGVFGSSASDTTASEVDPSSSATTTNLFAAASTSSSPFAAAPSAEFVFGQTRSGLKRSREESSMDADQPGPSTRSTSSLWPSASSSNETKGVAYPLAKKKRGCTSQDADQLQTNIFGERIPEIGQPSLRHQQLTLTSQLHGDTEEHDDEEDNEVTMGDGCQHEQEVAASSLDSQQQPQQEEEEEEEEDEESGEYEAAVTSHQQQHNDDVSASYGSEMVASSNQPSGAGDVIVLSSDSEAAAEDDDDDDDDQQPSQMREDGEIDDEDVEEMGQDDNNMMVETSDQQQAGSSIDVVPSVPADEGVGMLRSAVIASSSSSSSRPIFSTRPPLLLPPDVAGRGPRHFRPGPLTPGMPMQSNEEADGVVPYTPTLLPQRAHDEGYYPISSPRVPPQQTSRFRFEDVSTPQPIAAVPGAESEFLVDSGAAASHQQQMMTGLSSTSSSSGGNITSTSISAQQSSSSVAPSTSPQPRHSTEIAAVSSSSIQEVEEEGGETEEDCMESEQVAGSSSSASSSSNIGATGGEGSSTDQQSSTIPRTSLIKRGPRGFKLRVIGTSRNRSNNPTSNSPSTSNQP